MYYIEEVVAKEVTKIVHLPLTRKQAHKVFFWWDGKGAGFSEEAFSCPPPEGVVLASKTRGDKLYFLYFLKKE